jgi:hypothetical protein
LPFDWRVSLDRPHDTYEKYLVPVIRHAKAVSGWDKVDVVAHSMGGLLARSCIQSEAFDHDIDKFAMVGTPNKGSLKPYYLWEGGDPKRLDEEHLDQEVKTFPPTPYLYSNICNNIYKEMNWGLPMFLYADDLLGSTFLPGIPLRMAISKETARNFFRSSAMGLNQLMPVFDNCLSGSNNKIGKQNVNSWLINLNQGPHLERIQHDGEVITKIFGSSQKETISQITVKPSSISNLYEDGEPKGDCTKHFAGDTTVLWESAQLENVDNASPSEGDHGSLIKTFAYNIKLFLDNGRTFGAIPRTSIAEAAASASTVIGLSFSGPAVPLITGTRFKCGIDDRIQKSYDKPGSCDIVRDPSGGGISLTNLRKGNYTVTLTGNSVGEMFLDLTFVRDNSTYEQKQALFYPGKTTSFWFGFDPAAATPIKIQDRLPKPQNLRALPVNIDGVEKTKLTWGPVSDSSVGSYRIYTRKEGQPFLTRLKTVSGSTTQCWTSLPWESPVRVFAVSAVKRFGKEGFLSSFVTNETASVANFSASPLQGAAPLQVTFSDTTLGGPTSWLWDFGDETTSTETNPVHIYQNSGSYTVSLTITGPDGSDLIAKPDYVVVQ